MSESRSSDPLHGYRHDDIDRGAQSLDLAFRRLDSQGPEGVLRGWCQQPGDQLYVLSAGAGTGRELCELVRRVEADSTTTADDERIQAVALDHHHFEGLSADPETNNAFADGRFTYLQQEIQTASTDHPYSLVVAHEVLPENDNPDELVECLWLLLRRDGPAVLYLTIDPLQRQDLEGVLRHIRSKRWKVRGAESTLLIPEAVARGLGKQALPRLSIKIWQDDPKEPSDPFAVLAATPPFVPPRKRLLIRV